MRVYDLARRVSMILVKVVGATEYVKRSGPSSYTRTVRCARGVGDEDLVVRCRRREAHLLCLPVEHVPLILAIASHARLLHSNVVTAR